MQISHFNRNYLYLFFICMVTLSLSSNIAGAEINTENSSAKGADNKIHITSDRLESHSESKYAEFIGNVIATQGETIIMTDSLKIYYAGNLEKDDNKDASEDNGAIKKIEATGNVQITFDNRVAVAEQAVYDADNGVLILSGQNTKIVSGKNTISGSQITLYREDGRIRVESDESNRVEGIIFPGKEMNFNLEQPGLETKSDKSESENQVEQMSEIREMDDQATED